MNPLKCYFANFFLYVKYVAAFTCIACVSVCVRGEQVRIPKESGEEKLADRLIVELLRRGNKYQPTFPYGEIDSIPLSTVIKDVENNDLDIFWALSSPDYEKNFQAIYIPLYRGLFGMRLAIVKRENAYLFEDVKSLGDLKRFTAGQGKFWADTQILENNGLPVVKELKYSNLFRMLEAERFDYFPRAIQEPWLEVQREANLNLVIDKSLLLWYKAPFYFFVNKNNQALAKHLTEQLELMIADGSFDEIFFADEETQMALKNSDIKNRRVIKLANPFLSDKTPLERNELWLDPSDLNVKTYTSRGQK
ncbi:transporter substrate-binding domain-containing protein [Teredinibacter waterburyi]|uniref:transporter substrate-binding domain-containing protein n=1 Tax=Teredinibacter waterburyi TaxID=1500538 RepID=UPI00165F8F62|nr:transporter substrate-binding domain-containing protein [Teredinibacter waterburyi]